MLVGPGHRQVRGRSGSQLALQRRQTGRAVGVGVGGLDLVRDAELVAQLADELLPRRVGLDVGADGVVVVVGPDRRQRAALEQAELGGGVAGRHCAEVAALQDEHVETGALRQEGSGHAGDAGAHDDDLRLGGQRRRLLVRDPRCTGPPQGRHDQTLARDDQPSPVNPRRAGRRGPAGVT